MNQPKTPLPFEVHEATSTRTGFDIQSAEGAALVAYNLSQREDAAYIVHACNAYPKLIAALQKLHDSKAMNAWGHEICRSTLREIWEAE